MGRRYPNHQRVKSHRNYSVEEVATLFSIHKNTVRGWIKAGGLPTCDDKRPILILGCDLKAFLRTRRTRNKQTCRPGEIYCVRCRAPKPPAGDMADYLPFTERIGNLRGICPDCESIMHRCVSMAKLGKVRGKLDITFPQAPQRISESSHPTVNSDLR